jgi:hypothetical protein
MSATATRHRARENEAIPLGDGKIRRKRAKQQPLPLNIDPTDPREKSVAILRSNAYGRCYSEPWAPHARDTLSLLDTVTRKHEEALHSLEIVADYAKTPADYAQLQSKLWAAEKRAENAEGKLTPAYYAVRLGWLCLMFTMLAITLAMLFPAV